ncbi:MAG: hypothetical protein FWC66_04505 [Oscillospiraceae bacterium]|nr:hypothetical protein [Oscillospiraceae bacterium]
MNRYKFKKIASIFFVTLMLVMFGTPVLSYYEQEINVQDIVVFGAVADSINEYGVPVFYITVSPEEWEENYLEHPFFQDRRNRREGEAVFVLAYQDLIVPHNADWCSRCHRQTVWEHRQWTNVESVIVRCPGSTANFDARVAYTWTTRYRCASCGHFHSNYRWNSDRRTWGWHMDCWKNLNTTVRIEVGSVFMNHGCVWRATSITPGTSGVVHGFPVSSGDPRGCNALGNCAAWRTCAHWW